jgi:hypothetical protein
MTKASASRRAKARQNLKHVGRPPSANRQPQRSPASDGGPTPGHGFTPVATRARHDGFTAERQQGFIEALAECGCVNEACARVGISATAAYALRRRIDAQSFRLAWDAALDYAVRRLSDAMFSRAINGVARPVYYQGEQIGERRYYDERAAMFILRYRDPTRYGKFMDKMVAERPVDAAAMTLNRAIDRTAEDAYAMEDGESPEPRPPLEGLEILIPSEEEEKEAVAAEWVARAKAEDAFWEEERRKEPERIAAALARVAAAAETPPDTPPAPPPSYPADGAPPSSRISFVPRPEPRVRLLGDGPDGRSGYG